MTMKSLLTFALLTLAACDDSTPTTAPAPEKPAAPAAKKPAAPAAKSPEKPTAEPTGTDRSGEKVYAQICVTCHQATGEGLPGAFPPLAGSEWVNGDADTIIKIVLNGLMGEIEVKGQTFNSIMTPNKDLLSDDEIANVLTHVRSSWGNTSDAVTAEQVKAVREATKDRTTSWTVAELKGE